MGKIVTTIVFLCRPCYDCNMSCNASTSNHASGAFTQATGPVQFDQDVTSVDGRILILSNCPESWIEDFGDSDPVTLHRAHIYLDANVQQSVRLWFWHLNRIEDESTAFLRILVKMLNSGETASLSNVKFQYDVVSSSTGMATLGQCLAVAQMQRSYQSGTGQSVTSTEMSLSSPLGTIEVPYNQVVGGIVEFDLESEEDAVFIIRFVGTRNAASVGSSSQSVWPLSNHLVDGTAHIRGTWPQSNLELSYSGDPFNALDTQPSMGSPPVAGADDVRHYDVLESNGIHYWNSSSSDESGPFGSETGGPNATSNKGLYGVDLILRTHVKNSDPSFPRPIQHFFAPRCSGSNVNDPRGKFWGAGAVDSGFPYTGSTCGIPRMRFKGITTTCDATNFPPNSTDIGNIEFPYITVNANTTDQLLRYYLVIGGASDLPASLAQTRIAIAQAQEPD